MLKHEAVLVVNNRISGYDTLIRQQIHLIIQLPLSACLGHGLKQHSGGFGLESNVPRTYLAAPVMHRTRSFRLSTAASNCAEI